MSIRQTATAASPAASPLSDLGWLIGVICCGALLLLRVPRDRLKAREDELDRTDAAALAFSLWRLTPQEMLQLRQLRRLVHTASVLFIGGCVGGGTLCVGAQLLSAARALVTSGSATAFTWVSLGMAIRREWVREREEEGIAVRPRPRLRPPASATPTKGRPAASSGSDAPVPPAPLVQMQRDVRT